MVLARSRILTAISLDPLHHTIQAEYLSTILNKYARSNDDVDQVEEDVVDVCPRS